MKALVGAFNQEKALVGAFSVIVQPVVETINRFAALVLVPVQPQLTARFLVSAARLSAACYHFLVPATGSRNLS